MDMENLCLNGQKVPVLMNSRTFAYTDCPQYFDCQLVDIFRMNITPSEPEFAEVRNTILRIQIELAQLEAEIERPKGKDEESLGRYIQQRSSLYEQMDAYKAVISPIRRLPPELLAEIFIFVNSEYVLDLENRYPYIKPRLPLPCRICSVWRKIAIGLPALWTNIYLRCSPTNCASRTSLANLYLDRAHWQALPLSLKLALNSSSVYEKSSNTDLIVATILRCLPACRILHLNAPWAILTHALVHPSGHLDLLEELNMSVLSSLENNALNLASEPNGSFKDAPRLRVVTLNAWPQPMTIRNIQLPFHQLINLRLNGVHLHIDAGRQLFAQCINLEVLSVIFQSCDHGHIHANSHAVLPKLHTLTISHANIGLPQLLQMLTLPALINLEIQTYPEEREWPRQDYMDFYCRSLFHIESFHLGLFPTEDETVEMLETMPSLVHLNMNYLGYGSGIHPRVLYDWSVVPKLTNLHMCGSHRDFWSILDHRFWPDPTEERQVSRLKSVWVWNLKPQQRFLPVWKQVCKEGLEVVFG